MCQLHASTNTSRLAAARPRCGADSLFFSKFLYSMLAQSELNDALYWIRQALAVVFGLAYGLTPVTGAVGNIRCAVAVMRAGHGWDLTTDTRLLSAATAAHCYRRCRCCCRRRHRPTRSFFIVSTIGVHMYLVNFIGIEDQDYGGFAQVAQEGFPPAFATFTLWWMITYSLSHAAPVS
jgi:hypothetical protein